MFSRKGFETLEAISKELTSAKDAVDVLERIWADVGPYGREKLSEETLVALQRFFDFDDGE